MKYNKTYIFEEYTVNCQLFSAIGTYRVFKKILCCKNIFAWIKYHLNMPEVASLLNFSGIEIIFSWLTFVIKSYTNKVRYFGHNLLLAIVGIHSYNINCWYILFNYIVVTLFYRFNC